MIVSVSCDWDSLRILFFHIDPFAKLHDLQETTLFESKSLPPLLLGITWSAVAISAACLPPTDQW